MLSFFQLINALTSVRAINKTDAMTLLTTFGTMISILKATPEALALCPGIGLHKARKLHKVLHEKFLRIPKDSPVKSNWKPINFESLSNKYTE